MLNKRVRLPHCGRRVVEARYAGGYRIWLRFDDGVEGEIEFADELQKPCGPVKEPLKDVEYFKQFHIDFDTLAWPSGYDICPDVLYASVIEPVASV